MNKSHYIVEVNRDGTFELLRTAPDSARQLPFVDQLKRVILEDESEIDNREKCMALVRGIAEFRTVVHDCMKALVHQKPLVALTDLKEAIDAELDVAFPADALDIVARKVANPAHEEYVLGCGFAGTKTLERGLRNVNTALKHHWCLDFDGMLGCFGIKQPIYAPDLLHALNVMLGRRGVFSVGLYPVLNRETMPNFEETEHLLSHEPTGIEDVATWHRDDARHQITYYYTASIGFIFRQRLYFNGESAIRLYLQALEMVTRCHNCSVLWLAKRLAQSAEERDLVIFLFHADKLAFSEGHLKKPRLTLNLEKGRRLVGIVRKGPHVFTTSREDKTMSQAARKIADRLDKIAKEQDAKGRGEAKIVVEMHSYRPDRLNEPQRNDGRTNKRMEGDKE